MKEEIEKDSISPSVETVNNLKKNITKSLNQKTINKIMLKKKISPSENKKQELNELLRGKHRTENGEQMLSSLIQLSVEHIIQEGLEMEQSQALGRQRYERGSNENEPKGCRNGYEPGRLRTAEGILEIQKPQIKGLEHPYRSKLWDQLKGISSQLKDLVIEMYTNGMSTRDIEESLQRTFGRFVLSKSSVSVLTEQLHEEYEQFGNRDLSGYEIAYLFIDTVYEPLRRYGSRTGVTCCWAILIDGTKALIDMTMMNTESYESSMDFLRGMVKRGLAIPLTITTDGAPGPIKAIEAMWPKSKRVRCWFHKMQNLQNKVPPQMWPEFKTLVEDMRDAPDCKEGKKRMDKIVETYSAEYPDAIRCLQDDSEASLNHLYVPKRHRQNVRTTNLVERTFVEERRRTKTIPHLWTEKSLTKLVYAVLIRVSERWSRRQYSEWEEAAIKQLRKKILGEENKKEEKNERKSKRRSLYNAA